MDGPSVAEVSTHHKRILHSKRSFGKYPKSVDSPAYDASEEDNDPLTDDGASAVSVPHPISRHNNSSNARSAHLKPSAARAKHQLASSFLSDSDGIDSPTYDGDIESSTTAGQDSASKASHYHYVSTASTFSPSGASTYPSSSGSTSTPGVDPLLPIRSSKPDVNHPVFISHPVNVTAVPLRVPEEPAVAVTSEKMFDPASLTAEDIQAFILAAIAGKPSRKYVINPPPVNRPIRVYADGVYDLFHFGHALQLRQAKLSFPSVYLLVGVSSDAQVNTHKSHTVMNHAERCEAVRHCRWVDEIIPDCPWIIDAAFLEKWEIDYVAHDDEPYPGAGADDVYAFVKSQGKFIPTRRTPGVSTSELLERIVTGYRRRDFDQKLVKMGHAELKAEGSDYDERSLSSRSISPIHK